MAVDSAPEWGSPSCSRWLGRGVRSPPEEAVSPSVNRIWPRKGLSLGVGGEGSEGWGRPGASGRRQPTA